MDENLLGRPARNLPSSALPTTGPDHAAAASANLDPSAYVAQNFAALAENASSFMPGYSTTAFATGPLSTSRSDPTALSAPAQPGQAADSSPELDSPDDFYRTYSRLRPTTGRSHSEAAPGPDPTSSSMATALPRAREGRTPLRPNERVAASVSRSVSSPVNRGGPSKPSSLGTKGTTKRSVKDLTKQFDRGERGERGERVERGDRGDRSDRAGPPPRPSAQRPTATSTSTTTTTALATSTSSAHARTNGQIPYSTLRSAAAAANTVPSVEGAGGAKNTGSKVSSRPKFAAEDQYSNNNTQSFASRVAKSPSAAAATTGSPASRSMSHLPPQNVRRPSTADQVPPPGKPPLFGEVLAHDRDKLTVGYGIDNVRPRRTSESGIRPRLGSDATNRNAELNLVNWYSNHDADGNKTVSDELGRQGDDRLGADVDGATEQECDDNAAATATTKATRGQEAATAPKTSIKSPTKLHKMSAPPLSGSSRLPLSARKVSNPEAPESTSRASSRATSPALVKRTATHGTRPNQTRADASAQPATPSRRPPPLGIPSPGSASNNGNANANPDKSNGSLTAYIAAPPPKLSPPLRSSRPRLPVSAATTNSSRQRQAGRARSPPKPTPRAPSRSDDSVSRRRPTDAPINYAERRQHIHLKYTRSVRENDDALRAQKRVAERRRKEIEAAAASAKTGLRVNPNMARVQDTSNNIADSPTLGEVPNLEATLSAASNRRKPSSLRPPSVDVDADTLVLPGSFPFAAPSPQHDETPLSAVSTTSSGITQFDNEPQTEPPLPSPHTASAPVPVELAHPVLQTQPTVTTRPSAPVAVEYRYPFGDDDDSESSDGADISPGQRLDAPAPFDPRPSQDDDGDMVFVPGGFREELDPRPFAHPTTHAGYEATVTIRRRSSDVSPSSEGPSELATRPASVALQTPTSPIRQAGLDGFESTPRHSTSNDEERLERDERGYDEANALGKSPLASPHRDPPRRDLSRRDPPLMERIAIFRQSFASDMSEGTALEALRHALVQGATSSQGRAPQESPQAGLLVPTRAMDRVSQQTAWTDLSVDSSYGYPEPPRSFSAAPALSSRATSHGLAEDGISTPDSRKANPASFGGHADDASGQRPDASPKRQYQHQLDSDTRHMEIPYGAPPRIPIPVPSHSPPPVPNRLSGSVFDSRRTSAALEFYESSLRGSGAADAVTSEDASLNSGHPSTEQSISLMSPLEHELEQSKTSASIELSKEKSEAANKERHRLTQRRLVLKELIDTEAVFVRDMNIVEEIYKGTAEACPELDPQTIKLIFRNTDEISVFHKSFLAQLKEAASNVYAPPVKRPPSVRVDSMVSETTLGSTSTGASPVAEPDDALDRATSIGPVFKLNMDAMKTVHEGFLRNSDHAAKRLIEIEKESRVHIWLKECNEVAKELTAAWNLDSLLIKPMQRITKYPTIMATLLHHTPQDHPDREALVSAKEALETAIIEINRTKKNFELVGQIVGRKRKESDVKAGFARAFGKRVDKLQASGNRPPEDQTYQKLQERFGDDYLRLQVVLRDVEYYTRSVAEWVTSFMNYLSSIELVMRIQSGSFPELESKWVQFNVSMREIEKLALDRHLSQVRKQVIEPFEQVIKSYGNPSLAMKKRAKRRLDFEKAEQLKKAGKTPDVKLRELVEQYEALNDTLKKELPMLSDKTVKVGHMCLGSFITIQTNWFRLWKDKVGVVLAGAEAIPDVQEIVAVYHADFKYIEEHAASIGILNHTKARTSQSTVQSSVAPSIDENFLRVRGMSNIRGRGLSLPGAAGAAGDVPPSLPTPEFAKRHSGQFTLSPTSFPGTHYYNYRDHANTTANANATLSPSNGSIHTPGLGRPGTGRSFDSGQPPRQSFESSSQARRDSGSTFNSNYPSETRRYSGLFHSALPPDSVTDGSRRSSRASSREPPSHRGYNILWLAASLFEFNIDTTKHEAGYPYLTYQAGEIFDVIAEKGELWLAKNQDDPDENIGWIWSKHFAKLADP